MLLTALVTTAILLYFYYITAFPNVSIPKPSTPYAESKPDFTQQLVANGTQYQYLTNSTVDWEFKLPKDFKFQDETIIEADVCEGKPDGYRLLATGKTLYEYLKSDKIVNVDIHFESNAPITLQDKRVFYFTCRGSRIEKLDKCPTGHVFSHQRCNPINICSGEKDGKTFANAFDIRTFYECKDETNIVRKCPNDTVFMHDRCVSTTESSLYCQYYTEPKILNPNTLLVCRDDQIAFETCPKGYRYFDKPVCESNACHNLPDGKLVPLADVKNGPFTYSPGYMMCRGGRVDKTETCPGSWNPFLSDEADLTHLPFVFDGKKCSAPSFCDNVKSSDPDTLVPAYDFQKHVGNWKHSEVMDSVTGYECKDTRKRAQLYPGQRIGKRFKSETACDAGILKVPIHGDPGAYYDCIKQKMEYCKHDEYFDSKLCRKRMKNAFSYKGLDFFSFDSLGDNNWIEPWDYAPRAIVAPVCQAPETEYLETYSVCSHPDCTKYPFLTLIPFQVSLRDDSQCVFENKKLVKKPSTEKRFFWTQSPTDDATVDPPCIRAGDRIRTGNFVFDSTIYMTCDDNEPFVFCPSASTTGIEFAEGKKFACMAPSMSYTLERYATVHFKLNEVEKLFKVEDVETLVKINDLVVEIPEEGYDNAGAEIKLETFRNTVTVQYRYQVTYPPDVVLHEDLKGKVSTIGGGFLMKRANFTKKSLAFPSYQFQEEAVDFKMI